jgi:hypothetical protein
MNLNTARGPYTGSPQLDVPLDLLKLDCRDLSTLTISKQIATLKWLDRLRLTDKQIDDLVRRALTEEPSGALVALILSDYYGRCSTLGRTTMDPLEVLSYATGEDQLAILSILEWIGWGTVHSLSDEFHWPCDQSLAQRNWVSAEVLAKLLSMGEPNSLRYLFPYGVHLKDTFLRGKSVRQYVWFDSAAMKLAVDTSPRLALGILNLTEDHVVDIISHTQGSYRGVFSEFTQAIEGFPKAARKFFDSLSSVSFSFMGDIGAREMREILVGLANPSVLDFRRLYSMCTQEALVALVTGNLIGVTPAKERLAEALNLLCARDPYRWYMNFCAIGEDIKDESYVLELVDRVPGLAWKSWDKTEQMWSGPVSAHISSRLAGLGLDYTAAQTLFWDRADSTPESTISLDSFCERISALGRVRV